MSNNPGRRVRRWSKVPVFDKCDVGKTTSEKCWLRPFDSFEDYSQGSKPSNLSITINTTGESGATRNVTTCVHHFKKVRGMPQAIKNSLLSKSAVGDTIALDKHLSRAEGLTLPTTFGGNNSLSLDVKQDLSDAKNLLGAFDRTIEASIVALAQSSLERSINFQEEDAQKLAGAIRRWAYDRTLGTLGRSQVVSFQRPSILIPESYIRCGHWEEGHGWKSNTSEDDTKVYTTEQKRSIQDQGQMRNYGYRIILD
ncbi:uncharacterized protein I206_100134 [Kwoniella pini CBS 10737]|uniref:Uncharacterized protein n=1 Tax=Kwoniella pini CBS 10737 TaxID=1296096 RepID=A0A1B9IEA3_9TREE|nr:uncharacterized protein I206_01193 [Kwoniella pini CBS 10737]OCF53886.1 hypothetical protein I206_01193 [Kwoniella pini CBS 10737]